MPACDSTSFSVLLSLIREYHLADYNNVNNITKQSLRTNIKSNPKTITNPKIITKKIETNIN